MCRFLSASLVLCVASLGALAGNWPAWRGPTGDGRCSETSLPLHWSTTENVRWKVPLPGEGNSTPVIWGDRVFLTQAVEQGQRRLVMCLARDNGRLLWQKETVYTDKESTHSTNPYCSASPVTDGRYVIASLGSAGLVCYDLAGTEQWRKDVGKMEHIWGNASSPILYGDLAILWCGPGVRQVLLAVNKATGATVWEHHEPGGNAGQDSKNWVGSWSTPLIIRAGDHDELVLGVPEKLKGFDPKTGKELWSCAGLGKLVYTSPVYANGVVVALSGYHGPGLAARPGGQGDVTATHRLWHHPARNPQRIGSPVIVGDHVYLLNENGIGQCFELKTGKEVWQLDKRLGGTTWSSLVAAAGRLYATTQAGETLVLAASPRFELLARNRIGERVLASPAVADGQLFLRSYQHLWCIGPKN